MPDLTSLQAPLKVLIVDDEFSVLETLLHEIDWQALDLEVAATAEDGERALRKCALYAPDIVMTDITMPGMDGLQFMETASRDFPSVKFILLTAHRDFDYAQRAVSMGALAYLLKAPLNRQAIEQKLAQCRDLILNERAVSDRLLFTNRMMSSYAWEMKRQTAEKARRGIALQAKEIDLLFGGKTSTPGRSMCYVVVCLTFRQRTMFTRQYPDKDQTLIEYAINQTTAELLGGASGTVIPSRPGECYVLLAFPNATYKAASELAVKSLYDRASSWFARYYNVRLLLGISSPAREVDRIGTLLRESERALQAFFYEEERSIHPIYQYESVVWDQADAVEWADMESVLLDSLSARRIDAGMEGLEKLRSFAHAYRPAPDRLKASVVRSFEQATIPLNKPDWDDLVDNDTMTGWFEQISKAISRSARPVRGSQQTMHPDIQKAVDYIADHLHSNLTLQTVSEHIHFNPSYLSHLFKLETGSNFLDYVTELRIRKAKDYLELGTLKNYEIATKVGFASYPHFCTVFKRMTGLTPKEYRGAQGKGS